ncbi:MAG: sulfurtransferase [Actinomycetia bacterium]|nr:sulfurtransferase [Actinomycetes bacterium]
MSDIAPIIGVDQIPEGAVICDTRWYLDGRDGHAAYLAGHIPGAIFVDLDNHLASHGSAAEGRHPLPSADVFAASMGSLGIGHETVVVVYDDSETVCASRLVWMLRALGSPAALLDGGLDVWPTDLESTINTLDPVPHETRPWPSAKIADADETARLASSDEGVVLDARAPERYRGESEPVDPRAGHIPGALNAPFGDDRVDGRYLDAAELRERYAGLGVTDGTAVIVYCGSGVSACNNLLALERAGIGARLYPGSWSQWSSDPNRPASTA